MNQINDRNAKEFEQSKKKMSQISKKGTKNNKGNKKDQKDNNKEGIKIQQKGPKSWQRKIYINFNNTFKYYENEDEMYNEPKAKCSLFVRNFDILNKNCHKE